MSYKGTGSTITFQSGYFGEILNLDWSDLERAVIATSHFGTTGGMTFIPGDLYDPGELELEVRFEGESLPPINQAAETVTLSFPSAGTGGTSTWSAQGFMRLFGFTLPFEERQVARGTLKLSGDITVTP